MNLYHVDCAEVTCLNVFAPDKERAGNLAKIYLEFNFAEGVKYNVSAAINPMELDRRSREFLMGALARNAEGIGVFVEGRGWLISPTWNHPFPAQSE